MTAREAGLRRAGGWSLMVDWILLLTIAVLVAHQLFVPPIIGLADQGDYARVMAPLGLAHVGTSYEDTVFLWVQPKYRVARTATPYVLPSAELLLAGIARGIHAALFSDAEFDLRLLGGVHLVGYLVGIWFVLRAARSLPGAPRAVVWIGVLLVTPDIVCVAYLNSFYSEPASVIFLLMLLGVALHEIRAPEPSRWGPWACFALTAFFASTKVQNYVLGIPLAGLLLVLAVSRAWRKRRSSVAPLACALLVLTGVLFARIPDDLRYPAHWHSVFDGVLINSPSPAEDLAEFGLEPGLAKFAGAYAVEVDGELVNAPYMEVGARYGFREIARFYLRHPDRLIGVASMCASRTFVRREKLLGNYTRESGRPGSAHAPSYTGWTDFEDTLFPKNLWFLAAFFTIFAGVSIGEVRNGADTPAGRTALLCLTMAILAVLAFAVVVLAGGVENVVLHLFLFQVLFDVCLFAALAWLATQFAGLLPRATRRPPRATGSRVNA